MVRCLYISVLVLSLWWTAVAADQDPYLWLEEIQGEKALNWARANNKKTFKELRDNKLYAELFDEAYAILTSDARIPIGSTVGEYYYDFWQDEVNIRGRLRRARLDSLISGAPVWESVLDMDKLESDEHQNWVYQNNLDCVGGSNDRCLVEISRGGKDESEFREFSLTDKAFVEDGFVVPEAKSMLAWLGKDTLLVATDWGDGLTNSGYPLEVRLWRRGTNLADSEALLRGDVVDTLLGPSVVHDDGVAHAFIVRLFADWNEKQYIRIRDDGSLEEMAWPLRVTLQGVLDERVILTLEEDWPAEDGNYSTGDVVAYDLASGRTELVFSPSDVQAVSTVDVGANSLLISLLDNVIGRVRRIERIDGQWKSKQVGLPDNGVASVVSTSSSRDDAFVTYESSVLPTTLYYVAPDDDVTAVAALPHLYDSNDVIIEQHFATSADGEKIPYFVVGYKDILEKGDAPTILYGYGGFQISTLPVYYADPSRPQHGALAGRMWVSRGGVLALGNMRGGGEFGPRWHQAALLENRQRVYDDYFAIAEDLIERGITSSDRLGALGRSNGGLLLGVALTQRPDLFAALDIGVPLLDMLRYNKLLAGASWMGEYGNPDIPEDRAVIEKYSPYQNLRDDQDYPTVLFYTSTLDDRVHPGHARKMAARLESMEQDFFYYENIEGGHGGTANQEQLAMRTAMEYAYFIRMLMPAVWDSP
jgi:prolyl oligopeptidase